MEQGTRDWERLAGSGLAEKVALKDTPISEGRGGQMEPAARANAQGTE